MTEQGHIPTILDIQDKARLLPGRPQFWTSHDMAEFYQTKPDFVMKQFRRNPDRFPEDFWFELRDDEIGALVGHFVRPNPVNRGVLIGFTKAGALALSGVLKTPVADAVSVQIVRAVIAMEERAIADARYMMQKLRIDILMKKPIYGRVKVAYDSGWTVDQLWKATSYPRHRIEQAARELFEMRQIDGLLAGMHPDLFGNA